jgi:hypothetical protein
VGAAVAGALAVVVAAAAAAVVVAFLGAAGVGNHLVHRPFRHPGLASYHAPGCAAAAAVAVVAVVAAAAAVVHVSVGQAFAQQHP